MKYDIKLFSLKGILYECPLCKFLEKKMVYHKGACQIVYLINLEMKVIFDEPVAM